jgi:predicted DNA-binding WGR domain protein
MNDCFQERVKLKAQSNPQADVYKVILVSSYGRLGQRAVEMQVKYVDEKDHASFLDRSYHLIHADRRHGQRPAPR